MKIKHIGKKTYITNRDGIIVYEYSTRTKKRKKFSGRLKAKDFGSLWTKNRIPKRFREFLSKSYNRNHLISTLKVSLSIWPDLTLDQFKKIRYYRAKIIYGMNRSGFFKNSKELLKKLTANHSSSINNIGNIYYDTRRMIKILAEKGIKVEQKGDIVHYHDVLTKEVDRLLYSGPVYHTAEQIKFVETFNSFSERLKLKLPETKEEISQWGREQEHCIGSYANNITDTVFVAEVTGGDARYHVMFIKDRESFEVVQFYGKNNTRPSDKDIASFNETLCLCD